MLSAVAHSGRTDSQGGHWNHKDGTYHFHDGEYAGRKQSVSPTPKDYKNFTPPQKVPKEDINNALITEKNKNSHDLGYYFKKFLINFGLIAISFFLLVLLLLNVIPFIKHFIPSQLLYQYSIHLKEIECTEADIQKHINAKETYELNKEIPDDYEIGEDDLPREKGCKSGWGQNMTVYTTYSGKKLHTQYLCSGATIPKNIGIYIKRDLDSLLCSRCKHHYIKPDLTWYKKYLEYKNADAEIKHYEEQLKKQYHNTEIYYRKCNTKFYKFLISFSKKNITELQVLNNKYTELVQNKNR